VLELQEGDLIIAVDGKQCRTLEALRAALPGTLKVLRGSDLQQEYNIEISRSELRATLEPRGIEPRGIFMRRDAAPL